MFLTYIKLRKTKLFYPPLSVLRLDIFNCKAPSSFELWKIFQIKKHSDEHLIHFLLNDGN